MKSIAQLSWLTAVLTVASGLCSVAYAEKPGYTLIQLPPAGGNWSELVRVNDRGHGIARMWFDQHTADVFWSPETGYQSMRYRAQWIDAADLNDHDQVVGYTERGLAAIWSPDRVKAFEPPQGYRGFGSLRIDNDGRIYGTVIESGTGIRRGFHRLPEGEIVVDRPGKSICPVAVNSKVGVVLQVMKEPTYFCYCSEPKSLYLVENHEAHKIKARGQESVCVYGVNDDGDVLLRDSESDLAGFWSKTGGYVPIDESTEWGDLAGVANGGIVAARRVVKKEWQVFLWDRESGATPLLDLVDRKQWVDDLTINHISRHGVIGGGGRWDPIILLPAHWPD